MERNGENSSFTDQDELTENSTSVSPTWTVEFNYGQEDDGSMDIDMMWFVPLIVVSAVYLAILGIANRKKSSE